MKFVNKKHIQQIYREQMQVQKQKKIKFLETIWIILIVSFLIYISHFYH